LAAVTCTAVQVSIQPWQRELLLAGHNLLYWARTDTILAYSVCTQLYILNIWNVNTYVCTDKRRNTAYSDLQTIDPTSRQRGRPTKTGQKPSNSNKHLVMRTGRSWTPRRTDWLTGR
jgi:hypothetical protein